MEVGEEKKGYLGLVQEEAREGEAVDTEKVEKMDL